MIDSKQKNLPELFGWLMELGCFSEAEIYTTSDGFCAVTTSIADILAHRDITTVPGSSGVPLDCRLFFDDWYLYAAVAFSGVLVPFAIRLKKETDEAKKRKIRRNMALILLLPIAAGLIAIALVVIALFMLYA